MRKSALTSAMCVLAAGVIVAGCSTSRFGTFSTRPAPAPLTPAPTDPVTGGQLPPPTQPGAQQPGFPTAPGQEGVLPDGTTDPNSSFQNVATAEPVTREALVGAWKVTTAGSSCQMFMALTKWTGGFRAASRGCPGDAASVAAWDVQGQQVLLSDSDGNRVATLFPTGAGQFNGQTTTGAAISLTR